MSSICLLLLMLAAPLDERCPVDWRGVAFGEVVAELAGRLDVPYVLDVSVTPEDLARPVRLRVEHLTGGEVFVWLARSAGLEAVHRQGAFLLARPERLPLSWRARPWPGMAAVSSARLAAARQRRIDVQWLDAPLSQVAADVRRGFGLDLIAHPDVLAEQALVTHTGQQMALAGVCEILAEQFGARVDVVEGVIWIRPAGVGGIVRMVASRPVGGGVASVARPVLPSVSPGEVVIDRRIRSWAEFADCLSRGNVVFDMKGRPHGRWPNLVARGPVDDILVGARLVGLFRSHRPSDAPPGPRVIAIEVLSPEGE